MSALLFVTVTLYNHQRSLSFSSTSLKKLVLFTLENLGFSKKEVIVHLVNKKTISDLHRDFFNDPSPTDCITFPFDQSHNPKEGLLGEIFICPQVAIEYAAKHKGNPYKETSLYIVHALLHLVGFDDIESKERIKMRRAEKKLLSLLEKEQLLLAPKKN